MPGQRRANAVAIAGSETNGSRLQHVSQDRTKPNVSVHLKDHVLRIRISHCRNATTSELLPQHPISPLAPQKNRSIFRRS